MTEIEPALIKYVRRSIRRNPTISFEELLDGWRARRGRPIDEQEANSLRDVYEEEAAALREKGAASRERGPGTDIAGSGRTVWLTALAWIAAHLALSGILALPGYYQCRGQGGYPGSSGWCNVTFGLPVLAIGGVQLMYGLVLGGITASSRRAFAQGVFIGTSVVATLNTVLCFTGPPVR